ncbi:hypothetical protein Sjap_024769 [Stephania japonica]|uniref:Uncharacterized protein n=1 Tax=Stephania japonica TaxID=461633 RepID=A0AAP0EIW5_9MAGN
MNPNANKRKSFESKHIEERNRVNSRRRQLYAQLTQEEKDRRNYVRRVSYQQKRSLQCIEKGSSSKQDGCVSNERLIDGLQKQRIIERNIGTETWRDEDRKMEEEAIKERAKGVVVEEERVIPSCLPQWRAATRDPSSKTFRPPLLPFLPPLLPLIRYG